MNTALIGLDYIVDIMHPDGRIARCAEQAALRGVVARFNRALAVAEQRGWLRIAVRVGFEPGYPDLPEHSPIFAAAQALGALDLCGRGCAFHPDLKRDAVQMEVLAAHQRLLCHAPGGRVAGEADRAPGARRCQYDLGCRRARCARSRLPSAGVGGGLRGGQRRGAPALHRSSRSTSQAARRVCASLRRAIVAVRCRSLYSAAAMPTGCWRISRRSPWRSSSSGSVAHRSRRSARGGDHPRLSRLVVRARLGSGVCHRLRSSPLLLSRYPAWIRACARWAISSLFLCSIWPARLPRRTALRCPWCRISSSRRYHRWRSPVSIPCATQRSHAVTAPCCAGVGRT